MRKTLTTVALLLALSCPSFAGEMNIPNSPAPPPPPTSTADEPTDDIILYGEPTTSDVSDTLTHITLELLAVLPSLL
ncbi:MAG TPA: hypothetical protein VF297_21245 [Pyrinomonadaceae bacterium]